MEKLLDVEEETMEKILDVREMTPRERHPRIFDTFRALNEGEYFILVNDHDPRPLLYQFQNEHDGEFEWWPLEQGPTAWRVAVARKKKDAGGRTLTDYMQTDHRRLDAIFERFSVAVKEKRWDDASRDFRVFSLGLKRHIKAEEDILFPLFEKKTGMVDAGPTVVMRMEHKEIKDLLDRVLNKTDGKDSTGISEGTYALVNILADHNMKEEHILYPESDACVSDMERAQVINKAQAV
ncbi:MAG: DUF2249 domain-containing protein [Deltaproteobacteria bacterium]|nr:DUF2249 domain-containing protein [Deltaproteobacteria bacterium]